MVGFTVKQKNMKKEKKVLYGLLGLELVALSLCSAGVAGCIAAALLLGAALIRFL